MGAARGFVGPPFFIRFSVLPKVRGLWGGFILFAILLFVLRLALLLDAKLRLLSFFFTAFIFFACATHNYFSFRVHNLLTHLVNPSNQASSILADNSLKDKCEQDSEGIM